MTKKEAIRRLKKDIYKYADFSENPNEDEFWEAFDMAIKTLEKEPKVRWILIDEKLPEKNGRYIVTRGLNACGSLWNRIYIANYSDLMGIKSEKIWWQGNVGKSDFQRLDDVLAWMPLPEPYKEG